MPKVLLIGKHPKFQRGLEASQVLAGYENVVYRGDWYNDGYYFGGPAPTRGFWGKGSSGAQYRNGNANHHRYR